MTDPRVPDGISPIVAYRVFDIGPQGPTLLSPFQRDPWPVGEPFEARCLRERGTDHVPGEGCGCGVHALRDPEDALVLAFLHPRHDQGVLVVAKVALWGKVIEGEDGYRARFARIVSLAPLPWAIEAAEEAARRYGVPVSRSFVREPTGPAILMGGPLRGRDGVPIPPNAVRLSETKVGLPCGPYRVWHWRGLAPDIRASRRRARYERAIRTLPPYGQLAMRLKHGLVDGFPRTVEQASLESGLSINDVRALTTSMLAQLHEATPPEHPEGCTLLAIYERGQPPLSLDLTARFAVLRPDLVQNAFVYQGTEGRCPLVSGNE